ncbi:MAG: CCA tRNA nucleotidyltransferase [Acidobacteriia bacterium]|nr:CCA tRNA nucleotidyltransferase [Terriglobia bacterium]
MADSAKSAAIEIVRTLRDRGYHAYLVGGCVRDLLLGREPADYDVSTDAHPEDVMRIFPKTWAVGAQFGVVLVPVESIRSDGARSPSSATDTSHQALATDYSTIEVATFRSDGLYTDGRHPDQVTYSQDPRQDVQRRDFTINGLLLDPTTNQVLDYVGGLGDLHHEIIRTIGSPEKRFDEDKLRMLRAVRFAARFGYKIDPETMRAIKRLAPQIAQVSRERVRDELTKMLTEGHARRSFELLDETGLLREVLPEVEKMKGVEQPPQFHPEGDVWVHTLLMLEMLPPGGSRTLAWGALLHDVGKPPTFRVAPDRIRFDRHVEVGVAMAEDIARRLRMSNDDTHQIAALVGQHMRFADALKMKPSTLKRFMRQPQFAEHLEMHRIDCLASHGDLSIYESLRQRLAETPPEEIRPRPLITGHDLLAMDYRAGPQFREILAAVEDAQLEGRVTTRDQAIELVRREYPLERRA